jgi:hypothetical protein
MAVAAGLAKASCYMTMVPLFDGFSLYETVATWGCHLGNPRPAAFNGKGHAAMTRSSLTSVTLGICSTGRMALETGKTGATKLVEGWWGVGLAWTAPQWWGNGGVKLELKVIKDSSQGHRKE